MIFYGITDTSAGFCHEHQQDTAEKADKRGKDPRRRSNDCLLYPSSCSSGA